MKKITLSILAMMIAVSAVTAADKVPAKKATTKAATHKSLKKDKCVKGSAECAKKSC
jgi:hypothetical protein